MREELERRTKRFALEVIEEVDRLGSGVVQWVLGKQLVKAATSIGANYREACRAESRADFIHKIGVVEKEASETCYWLELVVESRNGSPETLGPLLDEARELLAIFTASGRTAKSRRGA
jgi:four helix bundle protein